MKADAIVYTSGTGHTQQYAQLLGARLDLPVCPLSEASAQLSRGSTVIYLGWISKRDEYEPASAMLFCSFSALSSLKYAGIPASSALIKSKLPIAEVADF